MVPDRDGLFRDTIPEPESNEPPRFNLREREELRSSILDVERKFREAIKCSRELQLKYEKSPNKVFREKLLSDESPYITPQKQFR
jgi:hypothetical protein